MLDQLINNCVRENILDYIKNRKILIFAVPGIGFIKDKHSSTERQSSLLEYFLVPRSMTEL